MLAADWTALLASERMAELHRQAEDKRRVRLAGTASWRQRRRVASAALAGRPPARSDEGRPAVLDHAMKPATPDDNPPGLLASKAPAGPLYVAVGSGASIDAASPSVERATARDGTAVQLRPLRRGQRELVARFSARLSAESRRRRFLGPMPRLPQAMLRRLVHVDGRRHVAVVAAVDGESVGIAHAIALADEPGAAEVAVAVTDRYQGRGIGRLLVEALRPAAVRACLATFVYLVDPTNRPALRLLRSLGVELAFRDGLVEGRQRLPPSGADPTIPREVTWATGTSA